jgi:DNA-binding response OmpR family regulator
MEIRPHELQIFVEGRRVHLTVREFGTLWALARQYDMVVPRGRVCELVGGENKPMRERGVDTFVRRLRAKLATAAPDWIFIHTHFGIGYRFAPERIDGPAED